MLELAVLGLLKQKAMHGYELKKQLAEELGFFRQFSYGSLYPTLKRLALEEAVEMEYARGETPRRKNVYRITPRGEAAFATLLEESGAEATESREAFMLRLAFFRYMNPETRRRLLEGRRGYLQERLAKLRESLKRLRERMDSYSVQLMNHRVDDTEHDLRWLDDLLERERRLGAEPALPTRPAAEGS
ncbi:MAG: helix-turn-helix transcriptional regulator [Acidobacteria bacterium]|nr:helix-turn-helix transcriptional regulator [Acidobacteriota bacterium]